MKVDIQDEIERHKKLDSYNENYEKKRTYERELATVQTAVKQSTKQLTDILESIKKTENKTCPAAEQDNKCLSCRACWDRNVPNVAYGKH